LVLYLGDVGKGKHNIVFFKETAGTRRTNFS